MHNLNLGNLYLTRTVVRHHPTDNNVTADDLCCYLYRLDGLARCQDVSDVGEWAETDFIHRSVPKPVP